MYIVFILLEIINGENNKKKKIRNVSFESTNEGISRKKIFFDISTRIVKYNDKLDGSGRRR